MTPIIKKTLEKTSLVYKSLGTFLVFWVSRKSFDSAESIVTDLEFFTHHGEDFWSML